MFPEDASALDAPALLRERVERELLSPMQIGVALERLPAGEASSAPRPPGATSRGVEVVIVAAERPDLAPAVEIRSEHIKQWRT